MKRKVEKLASFIKPASPDPFIHAVIAAHTESWVWDCIMALRNHYADLAEAIHSNLGPFEPAAELKAIKWARSRYRRKLTPSSIATLQSKLLITNTAVSHQPPPIMTTAPLNSLTANPNRSPPSSTNPTHLTTPPSTSTHKHSPTPTPASKPNLNPTHILNLQIHNTCHRNTHQHMPPKGPFPTEEHCCRRMLSDQCTGFHFVALYTVLVCIVYSSFLCVCVCDFLLCPNDSFCNCTIKQKYYCRHIFHTMLKMARAIKYR